MQHCADTGQAYWAWTGWDWARLAGSSSKEFLDGQALPTETAVRPFLVALAWLLGGFADFQHLGMFNRLHLAQLVFGVGPATEPFRTLRRFGEVRTADCRGSPAYIPVPVQPGCDRDAGLDRLLEWRWVTVILCPEVLSNGQDHF